MLWYSGLLANRPYIVILAVGSLCILSIVLSVTLRDLPDFRDPQAGFESRGTEISDRLAAWASLLDSVSHVGPLVINPNLPELDSREKRQKKKKKNKKEKDGTANSRETRNSGDATLYSRETRNSGDATLYSRETRNSGDATLYSRETRNSGDATLCLAGICDMSSTGNRTQRTNSDPSRDAETSVSDGAINQIGLISTGVTNSSQEEEKQSTLTLPQVRRKRADMPQPAEAVYENRIAWLCGDPTPDYVRVVYEAVDHGNLFTRERIMSMCRLESRHLKSQKEFPELCETKGPADCCPGWSLGGYIALLFNRTSCFSIQDDDVNNALVLARTCYPFYQAGKLSAGCLRDPQQCPGVPVHCIQHNAIFTIFHFLTDHQFTPAQDGKEGEQVRYAASFLPVARSTATAQFYAHIDAKRIADGMTEIVAMDFGLKENLFNVYLLRDASHLLISTSLILVSIWLYTGSLTLTMAATSAILFSLGGAYFIYSFIFNLRFFPFMNILGVIIALGVGADDTFIIAKVWAQGLRQFKANSAEPELVELVSHTLRHASLSMLVTSLTTTAAFFGSIVSNITAIKCFSVFAGMTILCNFLLMVTWVPAWMVIHYKIMSMKVTGVGLPHPPPKVQSLLARLLAGALLFTGVFSQFFEKILPSLVIRPRLAWIILLGSLTLSSLVTFFYYPGLKLPDSNQFQLLKAEHPFERYDLTFRDLFPFEKSYQKEYALNMPLRFVWGVQPADNGNHFNPADKATLELEPTFDVANKESQSWLYKFCQDIKRQTFYKQTSGRLLLSNCFIHTFKDWMQRPCYNDLSKENHRPCCRESTFPFTRELFNQCLQLAVEDLYETPSDLWLPGVAGPKFDKKSKNVSAIIIEYESNQPFTFSYQEVRQFFNSVDTWFKEMMKTAPPALRGGFFVSYLEFYDLQQSLLQGTYISIAVSMITSFLVLLLSTQNLVLSLFAILTVFSIIMVTSAILLLIGWQLNILESVTVSLAVGLSVDFTLHYAIMYKLAPQTDREACVSHSLSSVGSPVSMAAITTFLAGVCLLPTRVLAYIQIGTFITVLMSVSWVFSTFFFQAILGTWGPKQKAHFSLACLLPTSCNAGKKEEEDSQSAKQAYTVTDSIHSHVSNSSISYRLATQPQLVNGKQQQQLEQQQHARLQQQLEHQQLARLQQQIVQSDSSPPGRVPLYTKV